MSANIQFLNVIPKDNLDPTKTVIDAIDDFSDVPVVTQISEHKITIDIWLFTPMKGGALLKGFYWDGVRSLLIREGFCKIYRSNRTFILVQNINRRLKVVEISQIRDFLVDHVRKNYSSGIAISPDIDVSGELLFEMFLQQQHLVVNEKFLGTLPNIDQTQILRDGKENAYILFQNCVVKVSKKGFEQVPYDQIPGFVWSDQIIKKDFTFSEDWDLCQFGKFICNVAENDPVRIASLHSTIGFLIHNFSHPSNNRIVIAYDETITDLSKPEGGTGKGVLAQAVAQVRTMVVVDGKKFDAQDRFAFQQIDERTQAMTMDDVRTSKGGVDRFNSIITEGITVEHKNKPAFFLSPSEMPKIYLTSNAILDMEGNTRRRRQHIIEFGPFYSELNKKGVREPIVETHGARFFDDDDWSDEEWSRFFTFMAYCTEIYLKTGLVEAPLVGVHRNRLIQITSEDFADWVTAKDLQANTTYDTADMFRDFKMIYYGEDTEFKQRAFTNFLKKFAGLQGWKFVVSRSNSVSSFILKSDSIRR